MTSGVGQGADKITFITGTDTGVGKTLLTALLLDHLRTSGVHALAIKPFCSGSRADVELLRCLQEGELSADEINPYFFREPVAPLVAARGEVREITLAQAVANVRRVAARCECLLVEGIGGVLVPLGESFSVADLIARINCRVLVVSRNRLGTLNHTRLTVAALQREGVRRVKVVMMQSPRPDFSSRSNLLILNKLLKRVPVLVLPDLGLRTARTRAVKENRKKVKKILARILE